MKAVPFKAPALGVQITGLEKPWLSLTRWVYILLCLSREDHGWDRWRSKDGCQVPKPQDWSKLTTIRMYCQKMFCTVLCTNERQRWFWLPASSTSELHWEWNDAVLLLSGCALPVSGEVQILLHNTRPYCSDVSWNADYLLYVNEICTCVKPGVCAFPWLQTTQCVFSLNHRVILMHFLDKFEDPRL